METVIVAAATPDHAPPQPTTLAADRDVDLAVVARVFGVARSTVWRWAQSGRLRTYRTPTGRYRVSRAEFNRIQNTTK